MTSKYRRLRHQAAGHDGSLTDSDELLIFKPSNKSEIDFYEILQAEELNVESHDDIPLRRWLPTYLGNLEVGVSSKVSISENAQVFQDLATHASALNDEIASSNAKPLVVLENLVKGFSKPNILDVKLGKILYDDYASEEKKARLSNVSKSTTSGSLGFRICGMKIQNSGKVARLKEEHFESAPDGYVCINKLYGRSLKEDNVLDGFELFFGNDALSSHRQEKVIDMFFKRLQLFYNTLLSEEVRLISSSLLFIFEGDPKRWDDLRDTDHLLRDEFLNGEDSDSCSDEESISTGSDQIHTYKTQLLSSLSLIDFAHSSVSKGQGYDENVLCGVESLIDIFAKMRKYKTEVH